MGNARNKYNRHSSQVRRELRIEGSQRRENEIQEAREQERLRFQRCPLIPIMVVQVIDVDLDVRVWESSVLHNLEFLLDSTGRTHGFLGATLSEEVFCS